jgi:DNA-binding MarR family transcriptional regulator
VNGYEALLLLSRAKDNYMRRVDLARKLELTASGVTRLLDGLEEHGLVEKATARATRG